MGSAEYLKSTGVFVPADVVETIGSYLSDEVGVKKFREYFDANTSKLNRGDPAAEITNCIVGDIVRDFASLYEQADFDAARAVDADAFEVMFVPAEPKTVVAFKDRVQAAVVIQETDSRTVHTAIFRAYLDSPSLPVLPDEYTYHDD